MTFFLCCIVLPIVLIIIVAPWVNKISQKGKKDLEQIRHDNYVINTGELPPKDDKIHCPKCGSVQITYNKKGFSAGKAVAGAIVAGGIGLAAGGIGSDKIICTCLKCGKQFKPEEGRF